jgi:hypothetical protein
VVHQVRLKVNEACGSAGAHKNAQSFLIILKLTIWHYRSAGPALDAENGRIFPS